MAKTRVTRDETRTGQIGKGITRADGQRRASSSFHMLSSRPPRKSQGTLDTFVSSQRSPVSGPAFTSQEIVDRGSVFVANIYHAVTPNEAKERVEQMKRVVHSAKPATHEMAAWRCMVLKPGRTGLSGPEDFELQSGYKDDGERWGGGKILNVMEGLGVLDAVIIVSRWYVEELFTLGRILTFAQVWRRASGTGAIRSHCSMRDGGRKKVQGSGGVTRIENPPGKPGRHFG